MTAQPDRRTFLPARRASETFEVVHAHESHEESWTVSVGFFDAGDKGHGGGTPAEVFIGSGKAGTPVRHAVSDGAILVSLLLQHGCTIETINHALSRDHFGQPGSVIASVVQRISERAA